MCSRLWSAHDFAQNWALNAEQLSISNSGAMCISNEVDNSDYNEWFEQFTQRTQILRSHRASAWLSLPEPKTQNVM